MDEGKNGADSMEESEKWEWEENDCGREKCEEAE